MPIPRQFSLIPADSTYIDYRRLALYDELKERAAAVREQYAKLAQQVNMIANMYFSEFPDSHERVLRLRREIRLATRGVVSDIGVSDLSESVAISQGVTEQLYAAQKHLLKAAYRMLVSLVHPDRSKYDSAIFQQVQRAYEHGDLTFLQELYIRLQHEHDPRWRQYEGIEFWRQEIERPTVSLRVLQTSPEFEICRAHMSGRAQQAKKFAAARLSELEYQLWSELRSLLIGSDASSSLMESHLGNQTPFPAGKGACGPSSEQSYRENFVSHTAHPTSDSSSTG
jgi:hypothetical protein